MKAVVRHRPPPMPPPFPPEFVALLPRLCGQSMRVQGARDQALRARRSTLSQSGTFVGHRPYSRGDDLRRLDWSAYARSGELFTKQLEEEERRTAALVFDASASLTVGAPPRRLAALRLAAVVGALSLAHLDALVVVVPGAGALAVASFSGIASLPSLLQHLEALPTVAASPEQAAAVLLQRGLPGRVHWIGDFAVPNEHERPLHALRRRGSRVTGWLPALPEDSTPPTAGYLRWCDPETGQELAVPVDAAFTAALHHELDLLARQQDQLFARAGALLRRWPAARALELHPAAYADCLQECAR
ncbi:MAG: DUF58 domain-containing protein [Planctomycetes bacterium]|nr:DUF58 domain-containing protein [Planctomycetota bacterium]